MSSVDSNLGRSSAPRFFDTAAPPEVPVSWVNRLGLKPSFFAWLLALLLVVLVVYPFVVLLVASFYTGQPGRLGNFTLRSYETWLQSWDLLPILANSVIFATARLAIGPYDPELELAALLVVAAAAHVVAHQLAIAEVDRLHRPVERQWLIVIDADKAAQ